jgi:hypothetical protein
MATINANHRHLFYRASPSAAPPNERQQARQCTE